MVGGGTLHIVARVWRAKDYEPIRCAVIFWFFTENRGGRREGTMAPASTQTV